ncbi:MAG: hypothetical protein KDJ65_10735 [Anaerolineae bacterium]|nr:hypothetical protein [Anaerolineae bacterium]
MITKVDAPNDVLKGKIPFLAMVLVVLFRYIFLAQAVTHDVIYAAISIYLLLGGIFVPIYGILESLWPGSFVDGATPDAPIV